MSQPKLLSNRAHFPSTKDMAENYSFEFVRGLELSTEQQPKVQQALEKILESFMWELRSALEVGLRRGVQETINLIQDPDYYETVKNRNKRQREQSRQQREKWEQEQQEFTRRKSNPTLDEVKQDVNKILREMIYEKDAYKRNKTNLFDIERKHGTHFIKEVILEKFGHGASLIVESEAFNVDEFIRGLTFSKVSDNTEIEDVKEAENVVSFFDYK
jgi:hypothetical protein